MTVEKINFKYKSSNEKSNLNAFLIRPMCEPKGIVQIIHGMAEYIERYNEFANFLAENGYVVVGHDQLGHGESVSSDDELGYFGENGNKHIIFDIDLLRKKIQSKYPDIPYYILGHSMGSFLLRQYLVEKTSNSGGDVKLLSEGLSGAIIMGTGWKPVWLLSLAQIICRMNSAMFGKRNRSEFIDKIALGANNKRFEPAQTPNEWLSKNRENVDKYTADKKCGFKFTVNGFYYMFTGMKISHDIHRIKDIPSNIDLLFISGADDPVGDFGEGVRKAYIKYKENTECKTDIKLYLNDRHEILNETDRDEVYKDILLWLEKREIRNDMYI